MQLLQPKLTNAQQQLFAQHEAILKRAIQAIHERSFFAQYPEMPSPKVYGETADADGRDAYSKQVGKAFAGLLQTSSTTLAAKEESPYTQEALGISYPAHSSVQAYIDHAEKAGVAWRRADVKARTGLLIAALEAIKERFFEIAYATMHTTGQGYMMAFQASGPHANDRALEAIALGYQEQTRFPAEQDWNKQAGKEELKLKKFYRPVPKGIAVAVGCSTFPIWNSLPGVFASLITGNSVIVKPHPMAIYPLAICVAELQKLLKEQGFEPEVVQLAPDTPEAPITKELVEHPAVGIIDYTGGNTFGDYIEGLPGKVTFTEKAGINSIIIDSVADEEALKELAKNVGFSASLYSGQMCTAPQNIFIPKGGVKAGSQTVPYEQVAELICKNIAGLSGHPKAGPAVLGAVQNPNTLQRIKMAAQERGGKVLLESKSIENADFPNARTASPAVIELDASKPEAFAEECFGPVIFIIPVEDTNHAAQLASSLAKKNGAISAGAYTTDAQTMEMIAGRMAEAFTPVSFNLFGGIYINQNAGFSDFHVTGGNPAGNASLTDPGYLIGRFNWVGMRVNVA